MPFTPGTPGVKSVQTITATFLSTNSSQSVTISSVNASKSILYMGGVDNPSSGSNANAQVIFNVVGYISDSTSVQLQRTSSGADVDVHFTVVEYY